LYLGLLELFDEQSVPAKRWAVILDEKGDVHFSHGAYSEALSFYEQAHAHFGLGPASHEGPDLAWQRGMAHHRLGEDGVAAGLVRQVLQAEIPKGRSLDRLRRPAAELAITA
jgi:hypothetical protein